MQFVSLVINYGVCEFVYPACRSLWLIQLAILAPVSLRITNAVSLFDRQKTLFQDLVKRLMDLSGEGINVCLPLMEINDEYRFLAIEQSREISAFPAASLLEPVARNTASALTLDELAALESGDAPALTVTTADQPVGQTFLRLIAPAPYHVSTGRGHHPVRNH
jgi:mannose-1-phosphate guanylyltransferase